MNRSVLALSLAVVRAPSFVLPALTAVLVVFAAWPVLDDGYAMAVLRGVAILLACAWVVSTDDPMGEVLAAAPYPPAVRRGARVLVGAGVVVPLWAALALLVELRSTTVPVLAVGVEAAALGLAAVAFGAGLRSWRGHLTPSYLAAVAVLVTAAVADALPRPWALNQDQVWGPPWEAAHIRWAAVLLLAVAILWLALRDPLTRSAPRRG